MVKFPPIKKLFRRELFTNEDVKEEKEEEVTLGPFGYQYGYYKGEVPVAKNPNFFVFSYFTPKSVVDTTLKQKELWELREKQRKGELISSYYLTELEMSIQRTLEARNANFNKYNKFSLERIKGLLDNTDWTKDYCVMLILDESMFKAQIQVDDGWISWADWWVLNLAEYRDKGLVVTLGCRCVLEKCQYSTFAATCVRFAAMTMYPVNIAIWRDAHSSLPNPKTTYDLRWKNFWLNKTNKKFWIYSMVNYQAEHNRRRNTMLAATWAARKQKGNFGVLEETIADKEIWERFERGFFFVKDSAYGIDEQILNFFIDEEYVDHRGKRQESLVKRSLVVGMTHIGWLFAHKLNVRSYESLIIDQKDGNYTLPPRFQKFDSHPEGIISLGSLKDIALDIENLDISGGPGIAETYFSESNCLIWAINAELTRREGYQPTLDKLFTTVLNLQNTEGKVICGDMDSSADCVSYVNIIKNMSSLVPTPWHLWMFLFDMTAFGTPQTTLENYLTSFENHGFFSIGGGWKVDWRNQCGVVEKMFKGGKFDYDNYQYIGPGNPHKKLPKNITKKSWPQGYRGEASSPPTSSGGDHRSSSSSK